MATIKRFEELDCWVESRKLVGIIYSLSKKEQFRKDFDLVSQARRSAISTMANIAEGFHRASNKDFMKFLDYSRSSVAETISHCYVALDQGYISAEEMDQVNNQADILWKRVNNFIGYLNKRSANKTNFTNKTRI